MNSWTVKLIAVALAGAVSCAWAGPARSAPAKTQAPVAASRLVPAQPSLAGPEQIGVLVFFDFTPASRTLLARLPTWLSGTGLAIVLDREPIVVGDGAVPFARAFVVARTLGVTDSVLPGLVKLAQAQPSGRSHPPDRTARRKLRSAIADLFERVGINQIEFSAAWHSPAASAGLVRARAMTARFQVTRAPVIVVNGQWKLVPSPGAGVTAVLSALNRKIEAASAGIASNR